MEVSFFVAKPKRKELTFKPVAKQFEQRTGGGRWSESKVSTRIRSLLMADMVRHGPTGATVASITVFCYCFSVTVSKSHAYNIHGLHGLLASLAFASIFISLAINTSTGGSTRTRSKHRNHIDLANCKSFGYCRSKTVPTHVRMSTHLGSCSW